MPGPIEPTADDRRNGWTAETLAAYRREREAATAPQLGKGRTGLPLVGGNVVTEFERPKEPPRIESAFTFNPHSW
jgi:hypothetical protein